MRFVKISENVWVNLEFVKRIWVKELTGIKKYKVVFVQNGCVQDEEIYVETAKDFESKEKAEAWIKKILRKGGGDNELG